MPWNTGHETPTESRRPFAVASFGAGHCISAFNTRLAAAWGPEAGVHRWRDLAAVDGRRP